MKTTKTKHQSWTTAITFAEAGEWETARSFMPITRRSPVLAWFQSMCMAVTFAENGMQDEAVRIITEKESRIPGLSVNFLELCGLGNVNCTYGVLSPVKLSVNR
ncbi:MAG: hypothetical protein ACYDBT_17645 [Desulfobulbaceae bacterium]